MKKPKKPKKHGVSEADFEALKRGLAEAGSVEIALVSNSMAPVLPTGATAKIVASSYDEIAKFDLIVFWYHGVLVCHCVWDHGIFPAANGERTLVTKGLAGAGSDDPVRESWILGRVVSHRITPGQFYWQFFKARLLWRLQRPFVSR